MNTTDHYQLNQWDGPDRILRTDFNTDNLKTDDAMAAVRADVDALTPKAGLQLLKNLSISGVTAEISLADINWAEWKAVHITLDPVTDDGNVSLRINGDGKIIGSCSGNRTSTGGTFRYMAHVILYPMFEPLRPISSECRNCYEVNHYAYEIAFQDFKTLGFTCNSDYQILAGSTVKIWGEK